MVRQIITTYLFIFAGYLCLSAQSMQAQNLVESELISSSTTPSISVFTKMQNTSEVMSINLSTDLDLLIANKKKNDYQKAVVEIELADGNTVVQEAKIKPRGKSRRRYCEFPPIKIKFKKDRLEEAGFNREFNEYKLVTHCNPGDQPELDILKEFLTYKLYNELTTNSFKVQLVKINYKHSEKDTQFVKYGFLIEDNEELSERLNGKMVDSYNLADSLLRTEEYNKMALFQYMIGNTDWRLSVMHNIKIVNNEAWEKPIVVPYDFDFAGIVNTNYARPNVDLKQIDIRQRIYQGLCLDNAQFDNLINLFSSKKSTLLKIVKDFKLLPKKERKDIKVFLNSFFDELKSPDNLLEKLNENCNGGASKWR